MSIDRNSIEFGSLYEIKTASGVVSGVVKEAEAGTISVGPGATVVRYEDILSAKKVEIQTKLQKEITALAPSTLKKG